MSESPVVCTLPVFTSPQQQITFYADDPTTYQQVLTVMNPCEFPVRYQILVQASENSKYSLENPHGIIKPQHRVMVIIQHNSIASSSVGIVDKVKIAMSCRKPGVSFHKKELPMALLASRGHSMESILPPEPMDYFPHQSIEAKGSQSLRQQPAVQETRYAGPDVRNEDWVKKIQGYVIAFILGYLFCMYLNS